MSAALEKTNEVPDGWSAIPLGEVIKLEYGKSLTKKTRNESGDVPVYGSSGDVGRHNDSYVNESCLIVGRKGNVGNIFISHVPCWPIDTVYYVIPPVGIDIKFLYYQLGLLTLARLDKSTAIPGLNRNDAYKVTFKLAPPEQQKRIVAKIEELFSHIDTGIEALKKAKQLLKQYRQSVLKAAVTGELTKEWREARNKGDAQGSANVAGGRTPGATKLEPATQLLERILKERREKWEEQQLEQFKAKGKMPKGDKWKGKYKEPESAVSENLELPEGWCLCVLDQLITELKNGISKKPTEESGVAIFRISAVRPMAVNKDDVRFLPKGFDGAGYEIEDNDLLFTRYNGNPEFVGVCGKVNGLQRKTVYPDKLMRARLVDKEFVSSDYLELSLNCGVSKEFIRSATKTTAGQSGIAGGDVRKCPVVLPGYEEQTQIAIIVDEKFTAIEHLDIELDQQLMKAKKNKQSILSTAFSGTLVREMIWNSGDTILNYR